MKNEKGITLTSLMIYIIVMTMVIITVTNMTRFFYNNIDLNENATQCAEEYLKFISYITEEINIENNTILLCEIVEPETGSLDAEKKEKYIVFAKSFNQYIFKEGKLYKNNTQICSEIDKCEFIKDDDSDYIFTINLTMNDGTEFSNKYKIVDY